MIDAEIKVAVVPFERWMDGDIRSFCSNMGVMTLQIVAADPDTFEAGEIIQCPSCLKNMKAPMRARALRCANCRSEIHPKDRKSGSPS